MKKEVGRQPLEAVVVSKEIFFIGPLVLHVMASGSLADYV
jgi:hypothetical protein